MAISRAVEKGRPSWQAQVRLRPPMIAVRALEEVHGAARIPEGKEPAALAADHLVQVLLQEPEGLAGEHPPERLGGRT
jgi:hypothetical protein